MNETISQATRALAEGDLPTRWLVRVALECWTRDHTQPMWKGIAATADDARDYYASLDDETLRWEASEILAIGGWARHDVCMKHA